MASKLCTCICQFFSVSMSFFNFGVKQFSMFCLFFSGIEYVAARVIYVPWGVICGSFEWLVTGPVSEGTVMGCWLANALLFNTPDGLKISVYAINRRNAIKGRPV